MLIPWNTDAPIYHAPWATGGFILVNVAVFGAMLTSSDADQTFGPWILSYGDGLHPLQWITSNFLHAGVLHLLGNMIFLWAFGLVVEGKLGWWRFIAVYLGLGVAQCAFEQCCMLGAEEGGSLGASAIIYGLLAMAMVWAPKNEINCVFIGGFRGVMNLDISILVLAIIYIGIEILTAALDQFGWGSSTLHLSGAALGFGLGTWLVKSGKVDCEGWDLYAVMAGREGQKTKRRKKAKSKGERTAENKRLEADRLSAQIQFRKLLDEGHARGAYALHMKMSSTRSDWTLSEVDSRDLIAKLLEAELWNEAIEAMVGHLARFPEAVRVRLKLAQVLIGQARRPAQALRVLAKIAGGSLPASLEPVRKKLVAEAQKLQQQTPMELAGEDW